MLKTKKRTSEKALIWNDEDYKILFPKYLKLLSNLEDRYPVKSNGKFASLVNFHTNKVIPKHNWFEYKQGFSELLVEEIITKENPSKRYSILDPFTGVGTTNLVAQKMGYKSIGYDINPVATFIAKSKTNFFSVKETDQISKYIKTFKPNRKSNFIPSSPLLEKSFHSSVFNQLMHIKGFYESVRNSKIQSFFQTAYLSILEDCSLRVKDGNGLKMVPNKNFVKDVYEYFLSKSKKMLSAVKVANYQESVSIKNDTLILDNNNGNRPKVGLVIFSPPYANGFDYREVYKLELWMDGFVKGYRDFKIYREIALRSHVNSSFDHTITNDDNNVKIISELLSCFNLWNKNIPDMIRGYFDDMTKIFSKLKSLMVSGAACYIVVANSGYKGILVPTDLLLVNIAKRMGFNIERVINARKIRASSQQMTVLHGKYKELMRESIIVLRKP